MTSDLDRYEAAKRALDGSVAEIAQTSVRAAHDIGVEFDVDDPRVARWLMLTTFEGMFMSSARTTSRDLLTMAEKASEGESRRTPRRQKKGERQRPLVTWDHLVAWADADVAEKPFIRPSAP